MAPSNQEKSNLTGKISQNLYEY